MSNARLGLVISLGNRMKITQRQANERDIDWLDPFYESLMRPYVELTHEWDFDKFRAGYDPLKASIIQYNGRDIGLLRIDVYADHIYLGDLQIHNDYQRLGIGSTLLAEVIKQAGTAGLPVRLRVLKGNPAKCLYERNGFEIAEELDNCYVLQYPV